MSIWVRELSGNPSTHHSHDVGSCLIAYFHARSNCIESIFTISNKFADLLLQNQFIELMSNSLYYKLISKFMYSILNQQGYFSLFCEDTNHS